MDTHFDVLVLGTGLTQSIAAAALAKAGFKVVHVDQNPYYGQDQASLSHEELIEWSQSSHPPSFTSISRSSSNPLPFSRSYSLSLAPALIPSAGPLITALILSGVSRYGQFKLLDALYIYRRNVLYHVPGNKEDVFKARDMSLVDKRKLMRFLQFAAGEFEGKKELEGQRTRPLGEFMRDKFALGDTVSEAILYALACCSSSSDPTFPALVRLRQYLRSAGRYGNSPFLIGHYGGLGELAQGFCRTCAVKGGVYILGKKILSTYFPSEPDSSPESKAAACASIEIEGVPDILTADLVIASPEYLSPSFKPDEAEDKSSYACCIAITDHPISSSLLPRDSTQSSEPSEDAFKEQPQLDTTMVVFPPASLLGGRAPNAVRVLQIGEGTLSCPQGKYILYLWTHGEGSADTPEELLRPYLSTVTSLRSEDGSTASHVNFSLFYTRHEKNGQHTFPTPPQTLVVPLLRSDWSEIADRAAQDAESLFWDAVKVLRGGDDGHVEVFWPPLEAEDDEGEN